MKRQKEVVRVMLRGAAASGTPPDHPTFRVIEVVNRTSPLPGAVVDTKRLDELIVEGCQVIIRGTK